MWVCCYRPQLEPVTIYDRHRLAYACTISRELTISRVLKKAICVRVSEVEPCHAFRIGRFDSAQRDDVGVFQQPVRSLSMVITDPRRWFVVA
ncbi:MAG: hypothetical protein HW412_1458 [Bacteroidetes bacterium]|nr:hypothetical protein [Bacteroidota bacterium]